MNQSDLNKNWKKLVISHENESDSLDSCSFARPTRFFGYFLQTQRQTRQSKHTISRPTHGGGWPRERNSPVQSWSSLSRRRRREEGLRGSSQMVWQSGQSRPRNGAIQPWSMSRKRRGCNEGRSGSS